MNNNPTQGAEPKVRAMEALLTELIGELRQQNSLLRRFVEQQAPDATVTIREAGAILNLSSKGLAGLIDRGILTDCRVDRKQGIPRTFLRSEVEAYKRGGEQAVRELQAIRGGSTRALCH